MVQEATQDKESRNIWVAASDGKFKIVQELIESGANNVNDADENGYTPLLAAVSYNHLEIVEYLLSNGADVNLGDNEKNTPLHVCETVECAKILLAANAVHEGEILNDEGQSPLDVATEEENEEMIAFFQELKK